MGARRACARRLPGAHGGVRGSRGESAAPHRCAERETRRCGAIAESVSRRRRGQRARIAEGAPGGLLAAGTLRTGIDLRSSGERDQQQGGRTMSARHSLSRHILIAAVACVAAFGSDSAAAADKKPAPKPAAHDQGSGEPRSPGLARSADRREAAAGDRAVPPASWSCSRRTRRCAPRRCAGSATCRSKSTRPRAPRASSPVSRAWS